MWNQTYWGLSGFWPWVLSAATQTARRQSWGSKADDVWNLVLNAQPWDPEGSVGSREV